MSMLTLTVVIAEVISALILIVALYKKASFTQLIALGYIGVGHGALYLAKYLAVIGILQRKLDYGYDADISSLVVVRLAVELGTLLLLYIQIRILVKLFKTAHTIDTKK